MIDRGTEENDLFGTEEKDALHFDANLSALLRANGNRYSEDPNWDFSAASAYAEDLTALNSLGTSVQKRLDMYNPMYYLSAYYEGYGSSTVAAHWRIRTGIEQGDTPLTVETNLALALARAEGVSDVDFAMVWGQGSAQAERTGGAAENFIQWVNKCCAE